MFLRKTAFAIFFSLLLTSCVEVYDIRYDLNADIITVDGFVTNERGLTVNLRRIRSLRVVTIMHSPYGSVWLR